MHFALRDYSKFSGSKPATVDEDTTDKTINIFSLASGHLYERFLRFVQPQLADRLTDSSFNSQNHDAQCRQEHETPSEVLVFKELSLALLQSSSVYPAC